MVVTVVEAPEEATVAVALSMWLFV